MVEIEIMYADFSRRRVPIPEAGSLPRSRVLLIILSAAFGGSPRRVREVHSKDWYFLLVNGDDVILSGWGEYDHPVKSLSDPFGAPKRYEQIPPWLPSEAIVFEGFTLPAENWQEALVRFKDVQ